MELFNDLCLLSKMPKSTIRLFLDVMMRQNDEAKEVIIVTPTKAAAVEHLNELGKEYLSGKVNVSQCCLEAPNGMTIRFIPVVDLQSKLRGRSFKAMHFER